MFICGMCSQQQPAGVQPQRVVLARREVEYPVTVLDFGKRKVKKTSRGYEAAREILACPSCAAEAPEPEIVGEKKVIPGEIAVKVKKRRRRQDEDK